jgi:hypothetical protein
MISTQTRSKHQYYKQKKIEESHIMELQNLLGVELEMELGNLVSFGQHVYLREGVVGEDGRIELRISCGFKSSMLFFKYAKFNFPCVLWSTNMQIC